jgi:hypothetical protein
LLQPGLDAADTGGVPCYLETQTEDNVAFYVQRGFVVAADEVMPDEGLRMWAMVREPRRG